jgi:hypothetical protein
MVAVPSVAHARGFGCSNVQGVVFSDKVLRGAGGAERGADPPAQVLRDLVDNPREDAGHSPRTGWRVLARTHDRVVYGQPDPGTPGSWDFVDVRGSDDRWHVETRGLCRTYLVPQGGLIAISWQLQRRGSRRVILSYESGGGCGDEPAFDHAEVKGSHSAVTITVYLRPPPTPPPPDPAGGPYGCGGHGLTVIRVVRLGGRLGDRVLRDGATLPPAPVPAPAF